jgi:PTS system nitrogen regulatory IIA component
VDGRDKPGHDESRGFMKVADFLSPASTFVETRALDKTRLLSELAERAAKAAGLDAEHVVDAILAREELGSTAVGGGIAIPHARLSGIDQPHGLLTRLKRPIDFAAIDGEPVDVVFLLLSSDRPKDEALTALACATRALRNPKTLARLRAAQTGSEVYVAITGGAEPARVAAE